MLIRGVDPLEEDGTLPDFFLIFPLHGIAGEVLIGLGSVGDWLGGGLLRTKGPCTLP